MKLIIILSLIALTLAAPSQITNNNVGDIVNVGVRGEIDYNNHVDLTLINIIMSFIRSQNGIVVAPASDVEQAQSSMIADHLESDSFADQPSMPKISPEMIESFKNYVKDYKLPQY